MKVNPEVFFFANSEYALTPNKENIVIYAPLSGSILEVTPAVIGEMQKLNKGNEFNLDSKIQKVLVKKNILGENFESPPTFVPSEDYKPISTILMPGWDCNFGCTYCYSHGGENAGEGLEIHIAKKAIDFIAKNSVEKGSKILSASYHGGGEPLMEKYMPWVKEMTQYIKDVAKENELKPKVSSATNGFLSKKNLEWVINNLDGVNVSFDGPGDIQDTQRPTKFGTPTFKSVERAIKFFESNNFKYGIRSTITDKSVYRMNEIVQYLVDNTSLKSVHLEPLFECGRCEDTGAKAPSTEAFVENFIKAKEFAYKNGIKIYNSSSELEKIGLQFCGATGNNFFITPDGNVTTCLEVSRPEDDMNDIFIVGGFDKMKDEFVFDDEKLGRLRQRIVENVEGCGECFVKYNCSGDCPAKSYSTSRSLFDSTKNVRCDANKALLLHEIKEKLKSNGGLE